MAKARAGRGHERLAWAAGILVLLATVGITLSGVASAQDGGSTTTTTAAATGGSGADDAQLAQGAEVFGNVCAACHQAGGVGLPGQFPPLKDNPNVADAEYVRTVIANGKTGEIVVNGETYNGVMPAQSTLSDDEVDAVIAYIQSGFNAPAGEVAAGNPADAFASGSLPGIASLSVTLAMLIGIGVGVLVLGPRISGQIDRLSVSWLDAWLKTGVIVVAVVVLTVLVPNWIIHLQFVAEMDDVAKDLITVSAWGLGLGLVLWTLWWADRKSRI